MQVTEPHGAPGIPELATVVSGEGGPVWTIPIGAPSLSHTSTACRSILAGIKPGAHSLERSEPTNTP